MRVCVCASILDSLLVDVQTAARSMEAAAIAECERIGAAGQRGVLSHAQANALILLGKSAVTSANIAAAFCAAVKEACGNSGSKAENKTVFGEPAILAILAVMDKYPTEVRVQDYGCGVLWTLNSGPATNPLKAVSIAAGAVTRVNRAWPELAGDVVGRHRAIGAIGDLTLPSSIQSILDSGWVQMVLAFMEEQRSVASYQFACCQTLWLMSKQPAGKAAVLADGRSVPYLQRARDAHPRDAKVQKHSTRALRELTTP